MELTYLPEFPAGCIAVSLERFLCVVVPTESTVHYEVFHASGDPRSFLPDRLS